MPKQHNWPDIRQRVYAAYEDDGLRTWQEIADSVQVPRRTLMDGMRREFQIADIEDIPLSAIRDTSCFGDLLAMIEPIRVVTVYGPPTPPVKLVKPSINEMLFMLGDVHYGANFEGDELFPAYNSVIAEQGIDQYFVWMYSLIETHNPSRVVIAFLGDMVDGTHLRIQHARETDMNFVEQIMGLSVMLTKHIAQIASLFPDVEFVIVSVPGNHARFQPTPGAGEPSENGDTLIARIMEQLLVSLSNVSFNIARHWYVVDKVAGHGFLFFHGDQLRGGRVNNKKIIDYVLRYRAISRDVVIDYAACGHFHVPFFSADAEVKVFVNGTFQPSSEYVGKMGMVSPVSQKALLMDDNGILSEFNFYPTYFPVDTEPES